MQLIKKTLALITFIAITAVVLAGCAADTSTRQPFHINVQPK